jgi:predicted transcriptional regulator
MADEQQPTLGNRELTTQIVAAYIRRNPITADALPALFHPSMRRSVGLARHRESRSSSEPQRSRYGDL